MFALSKPMFFWNKSRTYAGQSGRFESFFCRKKHLQIRLIFSFRLQREQASAFWAKPLAWNEPWQSVCRSPVEDLITDVPGHLARNGLKFGLCCLRISDRSQEILIKLPSQPLGRCRVNLHTWNSAARGAITYIQYLMSGSSVKIAPNWPRSVSSRTPAQPMKIVPNTIEIRPVIRAVAGNPAPRRFPTLRLTSKHTDLGQNSTTQCAAVIPGRYCSQSFIKRNQNTAQHWYEYKVQSILHGGFQEPVDQLHQIMWELQKYNINSTWDQSEIYIMDDGRSRWHLR